MIKTIQSISISAIILTITILCLIRHFTPHPIYSKIFQHRADEYAQKQLFKKAIQYYLKSIDHDISNTNAYQGIGEVYRIDGKAQEAISFLNQAIIIDPDSPQAYNSLGLIYMAEEDYNKAIHFFHKAIENSDYRQLTTYRFNLGLGYLKRGDIEKVKVEIGHLRKVEGKHFADQLERLLAR